MKKRYIALKPFNNKIFYKDGVFDKKYEVGSPYFITIKKNLQKHNVEIHTLDLLKGKPVEKYVYMDVPYPWEISLWLDLISHINKNILYIVEPPIVNPFNFMRFLHVFFKKIYVWNDKYIDNKKYFKYYMSKTTEGITTKRVPFNKKKLVILMNMNWRAFLPFRILAFSTKELYSERIKAINFFDKYIDDFSLFGRGWNKPAKYSIWEKIFGYKTYNSYKGEFLAKDKYKILSRHKFCICFDNTDDPGNISEKIFDCFKAKCVPVYKGPTDIESYIPINCFINGHKFKTYKHLYRFLKQISEKEYNSYINNAKRLLKDKKFKETWFDQGYSKFFIKSLDLY